MKPSKNLVQKINPESVKVFGLPLRINKEIQNVTFRLSKTNPEKYAAIKKSIADANGKLDEPIKIMKLCVPDEHYEIIDGHTRFEILMDLNILPPDDCFVEQKNIFSVEDAKQLAYRLNEMRRQSEKYQQAANAIKLTPEKADRDIASISGIGHVTISAVRYILTVQSRTADRNEMENSQVEQLVESAESGDKGVETVYLQLKVAENTNNYIDRLEDEEIATQTRKQFESLKYTKAVIKVDKTGNYSGQVVDFVKSLQETKESTEYDDDVYPVMVKLCKLEDKYSAINTVTTAGHQDALNNAEETVRTFLMNNMNENKTDVLEGVRSILLEALNDKRDMDITVIMQKIKEILPVSKNDYFIAAMQVPNNPEGAMNE